MPRGAPRVPRMTKRTRAFFDAYFGQAKLQTKVACEMAGLGDARKGYWLLTKYRSYHDARLEEFRAAMQMSPDEVVEVLTQTARDRTHKDHVRAAELVGKIHGLFNEKLTVKLDRGELSSSINTVLAMVVKDATKGQDQTKGSLGVLTTTPPPPTPPS